jgi:hypothetical protein
MPRTYGRIKVEVWESGSDYRRLPAEAQWAYQMLVSQPSVTMIGLLDYAPRKWARLAAGMTEERLEAYVVTLEQARYVIVDRDSDELLIRSFVKHDEPWRLPNLLTSARTAFRAVESPPIRGYLAERHPWLADQTPREKVEVYEREQAVSHTNSHAYGDTRSDAHSDTNSHGVLLADVASPSPHPHPSKGKRVGEGTPRATHRQEAALRAEDRSEDDESGQLGVRAECPVCGPLHDVGAGFSLKDHVANVHGLELEAVLASRTEQEVPT